jgi:hypothetical protein
LKVRSSRWSVAARQSARMVSTVRSMGLDLSLGTCECTRDPRAEQPGPTGEEPRWSALGMAAPRLHFRCPVIHPAAFTDGGSPVLDAFLTDSAQCCRPRDLNHIKVRSIASASGRG